MNTPINTWTDGYLAVRFGAFETRGFIELDSGARWPRTTGEDVIAIAALFDPAIKKHGTIGLVARWSVTLSELEQDAVREPHRTYLGNRAFWSALEAAAVFLDDLAVHPPTPTVWDALLGAISHDVRNVGPSGDGPFKHFDGVRTFDDLYIAQFKYLRDLRGFDKMKPEPGMSGTERPIPRTTNADVVVLADYWSKQLASVKRVMGADEVAARWRAAIADVDQIARHGDPNGAYPKNNRFWRDLANTAVHVALADEAPTKWDIAKDALKDSITHLPQNLEYAASKGADLVASAAHAVGKVANEAGKGLFAGFGTPLLVGAGLLGLFFITRNRGEKKES